MKAFDNQSLPEYIEGIFRQGRPRISIIESGMEEIFIAHEDISKWPSEMGKCMKRSLPGDTRMFGFKRREEFFRAHMPGTTIVLRTLLQVPQRLSLYNNK